MPLNEIAGYEKSDKELELQQKKDSGLLSPANTQ
jgi:hypothetical protein